MVVIHLVTLKLNSADVVDVYVLVATNLAVVIEVLGILHVVLAIALELGLLVDVHAQDAQSLVVQMVVHCLILQRVNVVADVEQII